MDEQAGPDFFVSYASEDEVWAKWITTELRKAGHTTVTQAQDFRPGHDFVHEMHRAVTSAERTIAVLSPDYLDSEFGEAEWRAAFASDPSGQLGKLVPIKVRACRPPGLLRARVHIDLVDVDEETARCRLLDGVGPAGSRPLRTSHLRTAPFPGTHGPRAATSGPGRRRGVAALTAATVLLVAATTGAVWALSAPESLAGRPSAARATLPVAHPTEEVHTTVPPRPGGSSAEVPSAPVVRDAPGPVRLPAQPPATADPQPPPIPPLAITTDDIPPIALGAGWSVTFEATGGVAPYTWSITDGAVPDGLVLQRSGELTGKATVPGTATFTVAVEDDRHEKTTRTFELSVPIPGDINGDGAVDCADMDILRSDWGETGPDLRSDLNGDKTVGTTDMSIMLSNWTGKSSDC